MGILNTRWCVKFSHARAGVRAGSQSAFLPFCCTPYSAVSTGSVSLARPRIALHSDWLCALRGAPGATSYILRTDRCWKPAVAAIGGIVYAVLQWGHRLSAVETAHPPRIQTRSSRFNGAIAFRQWKPAVARWSPRWVGNFNGATAFRRWKHPVAASNLVRNIRAVTK